MFAFVRTPFSSTCHTFAFSINPLRALSNMKISQIGAGALLALIWGLANGESPFPPKPEGLKVLESRFGDGVKISYKEVRYHSPKDHDTVLTATQE